MPLNLSKELTHVREQVSPNSLTNSCSGEGCRVYLTDLPRNRVVINVEIEFDARRDDRKRSDRLMFYGHKNTFVAVPIVLTKNGIRWTNPRRQNQEIKLTFKGKTLRVLTGRCGRPKNLANLLSNAGYL